MRAPVLTRAGWLNKRDEKAVIQKSGQADYQAFAGKAGKVKAPAGYRVRAQDKELSERVYKPKANHKCCKK
jgi:hypothetical protein